MIYVIIYNPQNTESRGMFRKKIMSIFPTGICVKSDVFLVAENDSLTPQDQFEEIVKRCTSPGDSLIVAPLISGIGIKGYPSDFREWIQQHRLNNRPA